MKRRSFLIGSLGAAAALGASSRVFGANERVVVGIVGIHDRGMDLAYELARMPDVELRYLADPDSRLFPSRAEAVEKLCGARPECVQDFRRVLDDPEIDAVAIATPDHWHALATVMACQAGKDVYVEKPTSHSIWESRKMIEAARTYDRVVQAGTQNRSAAYCMEAIEYARSEAFGDIHLVRIMNSKLRPPVEEKPDSEPPEGVDYDMWLGPAPMHPFNENHFHYRWHWFWDYGGGDLSNDGVHQIDLARWVIGRDLPLTVSASGGNYGKDASETPDTQLVTWNFDGLSVALEQTLWSPYMTKTPLELRDKVGVPDWRFNGTRIEVYGTRQFMCLGRMGDGWQVFDADGQPILSERGEFAATNTKHMANFIECVRSRKRPNADIEDCHYSTLLAHYGNISYRAGRGLKIDPDTEGFIGDAGANGYVKRTYREPWVVPELV